MELNYDNNLEISIKDYDIVVFKIIRINTMLYFTNIKNRHEESQILRQYIFDTSKVFSH